MNGYGFHTCNSSLSLLYRHRAMSNAGYRIQLVLKNVWWAKGSVNPELLLLCPFPFGDNLIKLSNAFH